MAAFTRLARQHGSGGDLVAVEPAATVLRDYQLGGGYTPGPLYAIGLVAGLLGSLTRPGQAPDARGQAQTLTAADRELAAACLLVTLSATVLLLSSDALRVLLALPAARRGHAARRPGRSGSPPSPPGSAGPGHAQKISLLPGSPPAVQVDELVPHLRRQVLGRQPTGAG